MARRFSQERHDRLIRSIYGDHAPGSRKRWEENQLLAQDVRNAPRGGRKYAKASLGGHGGLRAAGTVVTREERIAAECRAAYELASGGAR